MSASGPPAVAPTELTAEARAALLRKYRLLLGWRRARDAAAAVLPAGPALPARGDAPATPAAMRALAVEFPGCLRELDLLGEAELARRVAVLEAAPGPPVPAPEAWMIWIWTYHRMLAAAMEDRRRWAPASGGAQASPPGNEPTLVADFVRASRAPAEGRLSRVAIAHLAAGVGVPPAQLSAALFPARRPRAA